MPKHAHSIEKDVLSRVLSNNAGWVFTPADFLDLGGRTTVLSALFRLKKSGEIRQLTRGLYDRPRTDPDLGTLLPTADTIAAALARRDAVRIQAFGAHAANLLGLSEQVPMKVVFLTDGTARKVQIKRQQIVLKHTTARNMITAGRISGLVIQALRYLGKQNVTDDILARLRNRLDSTGRDQIRADAQYAPAWIAAIMRRLADGTGGQP